MSVEELLDRPEGLLIRQMLKQTLLDVRRGGELEREARRYMTSDDDRYFLSFVNVCHYLGLNPEAVRYAAKRRMNEDDWSEFGKLRFEHGRRA